MACIEGDQLKNEVLEKIEEYLAAEEAQSTSSLFDEQTSRLRAEAAHVSLTETRRRYQEHLRLHGCDMTAISLRSIDSIAV